MQLSLVETTLWLDILKLHMIDLCALSEEEVLRFFVGQRLLKNKMNCDKCGKTMRINKRAKLSDRIWWSCKQNRKQCTNKSIRSCSFFANSHLKFSQLLLLLYVWAKNYSNMQAAYETGITINPSGANTMNKTNAIFDTFRYSIYFRYVIKAGGAFSGLFVWDAFSSHKSKSVLKTRWANRFMGPRDASQSQRKRARSNRAVRLKIAKKAERLLEGGGSIEVIR
uniref:Transposase n=1 Tax=Ditylenchus dipsaci TaxID=166011 RepID=A0A915EF67_9BILA